MCHACSPRQVPYRICSQCDENSQKSYYESPSFQHEDDGLLQKRKRGIKQSEEDEVSGGNEAESEKEESEESEEEESGGSEEDSEEEREQRGREQIGQKERGKEEEEEMLEEGKGDLSGSSKQGGMVRLKQPLCWSRMHEKDREDLSKLFWEAHENNRGSTEQAPMLAMLEQDMRERFGLSEEELSQLTKWLLVSSARHT